MRAELLGYANYGGYNKVATNNPRKTNELNNILRVPWEEELFSWLTDYSEKKMSLRPEEKSVEGMREPVSKFCMAGEPVMDASAGILATAKSCLYLLEHQQFVGRNKACTCFQYTLSLLVEEDVKRVLRAESDITRCEELD